jgi:hypothetical protein
MRGRVCRLQLLLAVASAVILGSEPRGTRGHILLSQIRDFPELSFKLCPSYNPPARTAQKTRLFYCCARVCCRHYLATELFTESPLNNEKVFTEPLPRNGPGVSAHLVVIA